LKQLTEPFFEESIRAALCDVFARQSRYRMMLDDFVAGADDVDALTPSGFIFHMSRCGSTLVAQMIAASTINLVVSEAAPIDAAVQIARSMDDDDAVRLLRAMVAAYGRPRAGNERNLVFKLDSWHTLALPLFRRAFPHAPWVFLYRDPVEVLVSQMRQRGTQMVPQLLAPQYFGLDAGETVADEAYCARVLAAICDAAIAHATLGGGIAIDYRDLPGAVEERILPHFGIFASAEQRALMHAAARRNAKAPFETFVGDSERKRNEASDAVRRAAERHLGAVCERLARLGGG
jgi:hypothetical protein